MVKIDRSASTGLHEQVAAEIRRAFDVIPSQFDFDSGKPTPPCSGGHNRA